MATPLRHVATMATATATDNVVSCCCFCAGVCCLDVDTNFSWHVRRVSPRREVERERGRESAPVVIANEWGAAGRMRNVCATYITHTCTRCDVLSQKVNFG